MIRCGFFILFFLFSFSLSQSHESMFEIKRMVQLKLHPLSCCPFGPRYQSYSIKSLGTLGTMIRKQCTTAFTLNSPPSLVESTLLHSEQKATTTPTTPPPTPPHTHSVLVLMSNRTAHSLPSPCWCCPTAAWDQQWRHCGTGGSGLTQLFCCPGLAWPLPEMSLPSPAGTPHPPSAVDVTATANKYPTYSLCPFGKHRFAAFFVNSVLGFICCFLASTSRKQLGSK